MNMFPEVNQNIELDIADYNRPFRSIVAEVKEEEILVSFPLEKNSLFPKGTKVKVVYVQGENKYGFQTEIIGRKIDNISLYRLSKPEESKIIRIQKRDNFRVNANLRLIINENKELYTLNISAGGILFSCQENIQLREGEVVSGTLFIPSHRGKVIESITFQGRILRKIKLDNQIRKNIAIKFVNLDQRDQMKVIQYCLEKQKQNRRK